MAGIRPGDIILEWNGQAVKDAAELTLLVAAAKIGSRAEALVLRDGQKSLVPVTVGGRPPQRDLSR
jgi:serine protease Do